MRDFGVARRSRVCLSSQLSSAIAVSVLIVGGCSKREPLRVESGGESASPLNANPVITNFMVYAQNSATLRDRATVTGGDVGVHVAEPGQHMPAVQPLHQPDSVDYKGQWGVLQRRQRLHQERCLWRRVLPRHRLNLRRRGRVHHECVQRRRELQLPSGRGELLDRRGLCCRQCGKPSEPVPAVHPREQPDRLEREERRKRVQ